MIRVTMSAPFEIVDGKMHIRTFGLDLPRWNRTGATHRNHFSGFVRRNVFSMSYRSAHHARGADLKILLGSVGPSRNLFATWPRLSPSFLSTRKNQRLRCKRQERRCYAKRDGSAWWVLTAKSVARIRRGTGLGTDRKAHLGERHCRMNNYWAARLVLETASWKQTRIYGEHVILTRPPLNAQPFRYAESVSQPVFRFHKKCSSCLNKKVIFAKNSIVVISVKKNLEELKKYVYVFIFMYAIQIMNI